MRTLACLALVLLLSAPALAEPPAPMEDRVKILTVEMDRGPAEDLAPFLTEDAHPLSRWYAVRALGRIGDVGAAPDMLAAFLDEGREPLLERLDIRGRAPAVSSQHRHDPAHRRPPSSSVVTHHRGWMPAPVVSEPG